MTTEKARLETPKTMIIGPYRYDVIFDAQAAYEGCWLGLTNNRVRSVKLDPQQSDTEIQETLVHELLHCLGSVYGIEEWREHKYDEQGKAKDKIDLMASVILMFLRHNPMITDWLKKPV